MDLSTQHSIIGKFFPEISANEAWEKYKLSNQQLEFYEENGYIAKIKILDEWQVDKLNEELQDLMNPDHPLNYLFHEFHSNESEDPDKVLFHSLGHWRIKQGFHDLLWNPAFVVPACQLLGEKAVRFWHDQLFCKPAKHGGVVAWHQDYSYWTRTGPMAHLTCWVGLDDATRENGCVHYIPKSHRWGLLDKPSLAGDMEGLNAYLKPDQQEEFKNKVAIEMKIGYGTFHHPLLVHGSYENSSEKPRRAFVLNVFADGTESKTEEPLLEGMPVFKPGEKLTGQFFPLLFNPAEVDR